MMCSRLPLALTFLKGFFFILKANARLSLSLIRVDRIRKGHQILKDFSSTMCVGGTGEGVRAFILSGDAPEEYR